MRDSFCVDWAMSFVNSLGKMVEQIFPSEIHNWPLLNHNYEFECYLLDDDTVLLFIRDRTSGILSGPGEPQKWTKDRPFIPPTGDIEKYGDYLQNEFGIRPRDAAFIVPAKDSGINVKEDWKLWKQEEKDVWDLQIKFALVRWAKHINLPLIPSGFKIPHGYEFLNENLEEFFRDNPNYERNVFIMMRLDKGVKYLSQIYDELVDILRSVGLNGLRADDKNYMQDRNLWNNVCVYMIGCKYGIAVLENRKIDEFNPNIALEYGFMRALNKPALLLLDEQFRHVRADIMGTLWDKFDLTNIPGTMREPVIKWLRENCQLVTA